jgi:ElaB/YqjD/DUF883 family membrane-anchored ribosome-binding protein
LDKARVVVLCLVLAAAFTWDQPWMAAAQGALAGLVLGYLMGEAQAKPRKEKKCVKIN